MVEYGFLDQFTRSYSIHNWVDFTSLEIFMLKIFRLFFLLALSLPVFAAEPACPPALQTPSPEMIKAAMNSARDRGFLWRISKDGQTSFLYGTIHVAKFDWMFPGPQVMKALRESDTMALELDILDQEIMERLSREVKAMKSISMTAVLSRRMLKQAESLCTPYAAISMLTPELQVTALSVTAGRRAGLEAAYGIDAVLAGIGHGARKKVVSLETPELQLRLLHMSKPEDTIAFVSDSLAELESGRTLAMLKTISDLWSDSDYARMEKFEEWCECLNTENEREVMRRALDERNPVMAENINNLHNNGSKVFAAVGSLHMFGPLGLPALMSKLGYQVERVVFQ